MNFRFRILAIGLLLCLMVASHAQTKKKVEVLHADSYNYNKLRGEYLRVLVGNVRLKHRDALMFCDSVIMDESNDGFDAYGNVHINQGDTLNVYGEVLYYDGLSRLAKLRRNARMVNKGAVLTSDYLNYDMNEDIGYYYNGGKIVDSLNVIVSDKGTYYPKSEDGFFKKEVVLTTEDFKLYSDTLYYNTKTKYSRFEGPTKIVNDTITLISNQGFYNSVNKEAFIYDNSSIRNKQYYITGDTLKYSQQTHWGYGFGDTFMEDTTNNIIFSGDYVHFNDSLNTALVTDSAQMMMYSSTGDTLYLHSDSLTASPDTTDMQVMRAFYNVRFYREDMQGVCDSMSIQQSDSVIRMYGDPVLWSGYNQLSGKTVEIYNENGTADRIELHEKGFIISQEDSIRFNQIKGRLIIGHVKEKSLHKVDVDGNAQSVFFTRDEDKIVGVNKAESSYLTIYLNGSSVEKLVMKPNPEGKLYPPSQFTQKVEFLPDFEWFAPIRPKDKFDIFTIY